MEQSSYIFEVTDKKQPELQEQAALAIKCAANYNSRKKCPTLWMIADRLNEVPKASEETLQKRRKRSVPLGFLNVFLGLFALIPAFIAPKELWVVLILGLFCFTSGIVTLWKSHRKSLSVILLIAGGVLFFGGAVAFQELAPLLFWGIAVLLIAVAALIPHRQKSKNPFKKDVDKLLSVDPSGLGSRKITASFMQDELILRQEGGESSFSIPYSQFLCVAETQDLLLLIENGKGFLLNKSALIKGDFSGFRDFLSKKVHWLVAE